MVLGSAVLFGLAGCGGGSKTTPPQSAPSPAIFTVAPSSAIVPINQPQQFNAFLSNVIGSQPSTWSVNGVAGGNSTVGTITTAGLYTAPASFPSPNTVMIGAALISDSSKTANANVAVEFPNDNHLSQGIPVKLGTTGGNSTDISAGFCCSGTLGSLWTRADLTNPVILSNNHVMDKSSFGAVNDPIGQPGLGDNNCVPGTVVARMTQAATLKPNPCTTTPCTGAAPSNVDAAIAQIVPGTVDLAGNILDLGAAGATSIAAAPPSTLAATTTVGGQVAKSGRTTGLTCSNLLAVSNVQVDYDSACNGTKAFTATFSNQTTVNGGNFSAGGDSGSLIVDATNARAVALLYAGNSTSTVANPIANVVTALSNGGNTLTLVGGGDHAVSCVPEATASGLHNASADELTGLSPEQVQRATAAKQAFAVQAMRDSAINSVAAGKSADNSKESALVIHVNGAPNAPIPLQINGVRTRVVYDSGGQTQPLLAAQDFDRGMALKDNYSKAMLGKQGVYGVGIGMSEDNPPEPALVFFVDPTAGHPPFPAVIEGMRTKIIEDTPFRAFGWNQRLEPKASGCTKPANSTIGKSLKK